MTLRAITLALLAFTGAWTQSPGREPAPGQRTSTSAWGRWSGVARADGERTEVALEVRKEGAALSLPKVGVLDWPASSSKVTRGQVILEFQSDSGIQRMQLRLRRGALMGTWSDPRFRGAASLRLTRDHLPAALREHRVHIPSAAGHLGASLFVPEGEGPFPGVVFLHGSGPQPRDASRFHAREMARRGVAALIFDKRGVGESSGPATRPSFDELASDAISVAEFLRAQPGIASVGFLGHSQGGWVAPLAASRWSPTAFVIVSSAPLVSPARESQWEVVRTLRAAHVAEDQVERARAAIMHWYEAIKTLQWSPFEAEMKALQREPWFAQSGLSDLTRPGDARTTADILSDYDYDPLPALRSTHAPILWILSREDESIDAVETAGLLETQIAAGRNIRLKWYQGYDHALRSLGAGGKPLRWPRIPPDFLDLQADFVRGTTDAKHPARNSPKGGGPTHPHVNP